MTDLMIAEHGRNRWLDICPFLFRTNIQSFENERTKAGWPVAVDNFRKFCLSVGKAVYSI